MSNSMWNGWSAITVSRVASRKARAEEAGQKILDYISKNEPRLWSGENITDLDTDAINAIQDLLLGKLDLELRHEVAHQFRKGIEAGNQKQVWRIPLPDLELRILPPSPLVKPIEFAGRRAISKLMKWILKNMGTLAGMRTAKPGLLQISALMGGAILRQNEAEKLAHLSSKDIVRANGMLFTEGVPNFV